MTSNMHNTGDGLTPVGSAAVTWTQVSEQLAQLRDDPDVAPGAGSLQRGWDLAFEHAIRMAHERSQ